MGQPEHEAAYNDFVVLDDSVYGFRRRHLRCVDVKSGQRRWKAGHYGHGQALLLPINVLLVLTETGEVCSSSPIRRSSEELGRFQAIEGDLEPPVIAHGRLYVRNDQEMAARLTPIPKVT